MQLAGSPGTTTMPSWLHQQGSPDQRDATTGWTKLHQAVHQDDIESVRRLVEAMADVDAPASDGSTAVHLAVRRGNQRALRLLIAAQADVNLVTLFCSTPMTEAVVNGNLEIIQLLSETHSVSEQQLNLSLFTAALNSDYGAAVSLLNAGADANFCVACLQEDLDGYMRQLSNTRTKMLSTTSLNILHAAVVGGSRSVVSLLTASMADVDALDDAGTSALQYAAISANAEVVMALLASHANVDTGDATGWSALSIVAEDGLHDIVTALIARNCNVNSCNKRSMSPLHYASQNGHATVVKALIKAGANIQCLSDIRWSPLHLAAMNGHAKVSEVLIEAGADVDKPDNDGHSPIFLAAQHGYARIVSLLIESGARIDLQENAGGSPMQYAAQHGHPEVVSVLIKSGAEIDLRENIGWTAMHIVCQQSKPSVAEVLINSGCQVDIREFDGWTPLHVAMLQGGPTDGVSKLIDAQADIELVDKFGWSPINFAAAFGHFHLIELVWKAAKGHRNSENHHINSSVPINRMDDNLEDRELSSSLSSAMSDAGFNRVAATLQGGSGAVLQDLIRQRCHSNSFFVFGSFADGWGSSLTGIDGRIDEDSDIDITRIVSGSELHILGPGEPDSSIGCPNQCTAVPYDNGHIEFQINVTRPNQMNEGSPLCPAIDEIRAHPCCNYPPVEMLQHDYKTCMPQAMLQALRECLLESECHVVSAAPPGMEGGRMRVSTTHLERTVMQHLCTVQGQLFIVLKYLIKKVIAKRATGLKTYHAKNLLFYMLDETPAELWKPENLVPLVRRSLQLLQQGLQLRTSSRSECMRHFFLRDAAVYLRGDHESKLKILQVVTGVLSELADLLEKYQRLLRRSRSNAIHFHPFTVLISASDSSALQAEEDEVPYHKIYPVVRRALQELAEDVFDHDEQQDLLMRLVDRLPDCARSTRECLRALTCLKFGLPLCLGAESSLNPVSREIQFPHGHSLSTEEAKTLICNHLKTTDSAWKFCFKFNQKPVFYFLPDHISEAFPAPTYSYNNYFYINFDALLKTLQLEFGLSSAVSRAALFEELLDRAEPDIQELHMALNYCQDDELLVRIVHKHRTVVASGRLFDEFLREFVSRIGMLETCESLTAAALGKSIPMKHLFRPITE